LNPLQIIAKIYSSFADEFFHASHFRPSSLNVYLQIEPFANNCEDLFILHKKRSQKVCDPQLHQ